MPHPFSAGAAITATGDITLTAAQVAEQAIWVIDPGGAGRKVLLPAEADCEGYMLVIKNSADAAEILTVKDDADAVTIVTPTQNETAILFCNGTTWLGIAGANS
jgi:hypothetical protein